jgi:hypothetical protein
MVERGVEDMEEQKQMTMYDILEQPIKQPSTDVNEIVDKKLKGPRKKGYIVRR